MPRAKLKCARISVLICRMPVLQNSRSHWGYPKSIGPERIIDLAIAATILPWPEAGDILRWVRSGCARARRQRESGATLLIDTLKPVALSSDGVWFQHECKMLNRRSLVAPLSGWCVVGTRTRGLGRPFDAENAGCFRGPAWCLQHACPCHRGT